MDCGDIRAGLNFREERLRPDSTASLEDTLSVTLIGLFIMGRSVSAGDLDAARELFRSFAWVHHVDATCYDGTVTIAVNGMPHRPFFDAVKNRTELPRLRTRTIRLSTEGIVDITDLEPDPAPPHPN